MKTLDPGRTAHRAAASDLSPPGVPAPSTAASVDAHTDRPATIAVTTPQQAAPAASRTTPFANPKTTTINAMASTTAAAAPTATAAPRKPTTPEPAPPAAAAGLSVPAPLPLSTPSPAYPCGPESGGAAARSYHTEHGFHPPYIDLVSPRPAAKSYPEAEAIPLPYPPRARTGFRADTPAGLGDLLALTYGVTRVDWGDGGIRAGRPVPSGGAAYPGELYLAAEFGLSHYLPSAHALERLQGADLRRQVVDALDARPAERPALILLLTSRHEANLAAYGSFGHKLQTLDTGVIAGQALSLIEAAGAEAGIHTRFDEEKLNQLLGLDPKIESVRAVVTAGLGNDEPIPVPAFSTDPGATQAGIPRKIMARRTAADGFESVSVPLPRILEILDAAAQEIPSDIRGGHGAEFATLDLYCTSNRVDGLAPACYRRSAASGALVKVRDTTDPKMLFPAGGEAELAHFQAACTLMIVGDYEHGYRVHGDRWYRMLNLQAGILSQRVGLAATGLGLGSMLRCDYQTKVADRLIHAAPGRTVLVTVLVGLEHGVGKPGHRLLLGGYGS